MPDPGTQISALRRQQVAIAGFGSFALHQNNLAMVLIEATRACAEGLDAPFCKVCRYRPDTKDLLIEAAIGWDSGVVGHAASQADETSPQGRAFMTGMPSICNDLTSDDTFRLPSFYADHGIISTVDVVIKGESQPYGVLGIGNNRQVNHDEHEIDFLISFANVLAEAVKTSVRSTTLQAALEEKDRLLVQQRILAEELQHRVRNNMQLVYGMLSRQLEDTPGEAAKRGIRSIARRVSTLAQVYDNLLGTKMARTTDFGNYANSLCLNIAEIQASEVAITCDFEPVLLGLDTVTALGIVLAELVTNSYEHAFPTNKGSIAVSVRGPIVGGNVATLIVADTGRGFTPHYESKRHGLGLVRRLVEQVRGTMDVRIDHGTVWSIKFPLPPIIS